MPETLRLSPMPSVDWRLWTVEQWGIRLLEHFFGRRPGKDQSDVRVFPACAETLAIIVGEPTSNATVVRDQFVETVVAASVEAGGLLEHAIQGWSPEAPDNIPPVLAHLYLTCLAASEDTNGAHGEDEFIAPLETLCRGNVGSLENLPLLWKRFSEWLVRGSNRRRYRGLVLPDPAGWRRIGYSYRLAFPCRHDRNELAAVLTEAGLDYEGAPVARVVTVVADQRRRFRRGFQDAFDDFRVSWNADRTNSELVEHRFWTAVRNAVVEAEAGTASTEKNPITVVACEIEDSIAPLMVARQPCIVPPQFLCEAFAFPVGGFGYGISLDEGDDTNRFESAARRVLGAATPWLPARLRQGILMFKDGQAGHFDLAERDELAAAAVALVRDDLAAEFVAHFGNARTRRVYARLPGWSEIRNFAARPLDSTVLEQSLLRECAMLYESVRYPRIRMAGGVRCDDGYLGLANHLPHVRIGGADTVLIVQNDAAVSLRRSSEGVWILPAREFTGPGVIVASREDRVLDQCSIVFLAAPALERPRRPAVPADWFTEGLRGTTTFRDFADGDLALQDLAEIVQTTAFLGPDVGEFTSDLGSAAWLVTVSAGKKQLRRNSAGGIAAIPHHQATDAGIARRWRKLVFNSPADAVSEAERRSIYRVATKLPLPAREMTVSCPDLEYTPKVAREAPQVEELVTVLAGRSSMRAGVPVYEWHAYLRMLDGVTSRSSIEWVSRAWEESGLVDLLWHTRWRTVTAFPRPPHLSLYADAGICRATLSGLVLRGTRDALLEEARRRGCSVNVLGSVSRFVPATLRISAPSELTIREFATRFEIPIQALDANLRQFDDQRNFDVGAPPISGYGVGVSVDNWTISAAPPPDVVVRHFARNDRPDVWVVEHGDERRWSYGKNSARLIACSAAHLPALFEHGENEFRASGAFLPLPLVRILSSVAEARPGPTDETNYLYSFPTARLKNEFLAAIRKSPSA